MNKQQLAAKIWASANQMRSKIEANEYKDYILGLIFYKYLSEKETQFAYKEDYEEKDLKELREEDEETVKHFQENLGYFITYDNLFSTWIKKGKDFDVSNLRDALSAFNRLINSAHKKLFNDIFKTLETGLSKLGENAAKQTKAISDLLYLIQDIPMHGKQDYDVLGFIYEYLIGMFAANAGKKAGEFYTPNEVSVLMSDIIADHLKDRSEIEIYDPTSGSGSLLINIGDSVARHMDNKNNIKYYAQELKQNTYNLTRMNLVMRGIKPDNIITRNGDTLEEDWPMFKENDPINSYEALYVDAVVSNPPYSQKWDAKDKETDIRYKRYGLAPKGKADYAFLLHDLFHIKPDGIMAVVLPHGVLFRGGEEGVIRKNLIEQNNIDTIIGVPPAIFFGTGITTTIIVLKQKRENTDVLIVDASKEFIKEGKNNKLQASDIKRIVDTVVQRKTISKYSRVVTRDEIRENGYNLNIPRYVNSSIAAESWDIYASMFGGIPTKEIDELQAYWNAFESLRGELFNHKTEVNCELKVDDVKEAIQDHPSVQSFISLLNGSFSSFTNFLKKELLDNWQTLSIPQEETILSSNIFERLENIPLVDKYKAYQLLYNEWEITKVDLEIIQTEGFEATKVVDPNMVIKKKDDKEQEVQDGWIGRVLPFKLVQETYLKEELQSLGEKENRLENIGSEIEDLIESLSEEEKDSSILNDANDTFIPKELNATLKEILADVESDEINTLKAYLTLLDNKGKKPEKAAFIQNRADVGWKNMEASKDGTFSKKAINDYLTSLQSAHDFPEDSYESKIVKAVSLMTEEKELKKTIKEEAKALHNLTKSTIEQLSDEQVNVLLELKWVKPLVDALYNLPTSIIMTLTDKVQALSNRYAITYSDVANDIRKAENSLSTLIGELEGNQYDMQGLNELKSLLKSEG
ncbi:MAG: type I restriction enzyme M protein [Cyclobacteriaceae bacterium]|jgi:type I restriction enzyme M protein